MNAQVQVREDLEEIQTEALGFSALSGEAKVRLLPSSWATGSLPAPTSSLLSIASGKGLLAAAGPEKLIVASTASVRQAFESQEDGKNKSFTPQLVVDTPRVSQVAFSSDENFLVITAENGGGLAIYDVAAIMQGNTQPNAQIATNGVAVRALIPNPATDFAQFFAVVTSNGQLMLANLGEKQLVSGQQGPVIKEGVSCVSWSKKGKQLVAGLGNGTAVQMTHDGVIKAEIPRPPNLDGDQHVSGISWLANEEFIIIYTPTAAMYESAPDPTFQLVIRKAGTSNYTFQKLLDPTPSSFGLNRFPPFHFINRLFEFPPDLDDLLIVSSTCSPDIGLISKSKKPLSSEVPAEKITNTYTTTSLALDHRRAQLPYSEDMSDTSPIGVAIDLSSTEMVRRPIPGDEMEQSATPLPALFVLNHEGLLSAWWIVYNDSVRKGAAYPRLIAVGGVPQAKPTAVTSPIASGSTGAFGSPAPRPGVPAFGQSSAPGTSMNRQSVWGAPSSAASQSSAPAFGKPAFGQPAFGQPAQPTSAFGQSSQSTPAFGQSSQSTPAFGQASQPRATFGSVSQIGGSSGNAAFGAAGSLGSKASPWATTNTSGDVSSKPANPFAGSSTPSSSPFGKLGDNKPSASPFSSNTSTSPFASMGQKPALSSFSSFSNNNQQNKAPGMTPEPSFGSTVDLGSTNSGSSFGQPSTLGSGFSAWNTPSTMSSAFGAQPTTQVQSQEMEMGDDSVTTEKPAAPATATFGLPSGGFKLDSGFKGDGTAKDDLPKPKDTGAGLFSMGLGDALADTQKAPATPIKEEPEEPKLSEISTTPASPPKPTQTPKASAPSPEKEVPIIPADAPLPPDPTSAKFKAKQLEMNANMPPGVGDSKPKPSAPKDEPPKPEELPPLAGSPPVDLGEGSSPLSDVPDESLDKVEQKASQPVVKDTAPTTKAGFSFTPESKPPQETQRPESQKPLQSSTTPFGFPKPAAAHFPPPTTRPIASPRSPSPTRNFTTPAAPSGKPLVPPLGGSRPPSRPTSRNERPVSRSSLFNASGVPRRDSGSRTPQPPSHSQIQVAKPKTPEPEAQVSDLRDEEDERIRKLLDTEVEPTLKLDPFIAHQDYAGLEDKTGLLGQMERIYRDINSMLDTLGLNARAMRGWIEGQHSLAKEGGRELSDLENDDELDDWCLVELADLADIQTSLGDQLDAGRVTDVPAKLHDLAALQRDVHRLRARTKDLRGALDVHADPARRAVHRAQPLSAEQSQQQADLRRSVAHVQGALNAAEEGVSVLRARLASASSTTTATTATREAQKGGRAPTVEAVRRTIEKMTAMAERRHNDVTVLEAQLRKLRRGMAGLRLTDDDDSPAASSLSRGSPIVKREEEDDDEDAGDNILFQTPPRSRGKPAPLSASSETRRFRTPELRRSILPGTYALEYSPSNAGSTSMSAQGSPMVVRRQLGASALGASVRSNGSALSTPRKKMSGVTEEDVQRYNGKMAARRKVLAGLREAVEKKGGRVRKLDGA
ncbi:MAG: hypothetical protein M1822_004610 [Bathelium mastoideum]|nr:MAG: hypothetical protein M1822_004610 [Bathelium mastoideum]